ncbi:DUF1513 domain-containing protein [Pokkaliibacter plantistimulans]|uniref:DUF1513 domain-containing protein n=1 Tax=Proteobacteria bacterium 228 TaxID=2083153 RepID=A0A2S5KL46_9PROT|nr:DUF1513 domain-containing protein [Pokkaliibacter plantistimulans]PPC75442.1 DUF1513 domain-containing protein [Pokkaliibacter plantistimulans]
MPDYCISRRRLLQRSLALTAMLSGPAKVLADTTDGQDLILSAFDDQHGQHFFGGFDELGSQRFAVPLPGRAHGIAIHPSDSVCAVIARRAGTFLSIVSLPEGRHLQTLNNPAQRRFYGHAAFSPDGQRLFTSENDYEHQRGVIGVWQWDGQQLRRTDEWLSGGEGPHEVIMHPDGQLLVANGGVITHPDTGRDMLNLDTMHPNLSFIDIQTGQVSRQLDLPSALQRLSIRHLSVSSSGVIACALQYAGGVALPDSASKVVPLLALLRPHDDHLQLVHLPEGPEFHRNYIGSVCWDIEGHWLALTAPQGSRAYFFNALPQDENSAGRWGASITYSDTCGITQDSVAGSFLISSGSGGVISYSPMDGDWQPMPDSFVRRQRWDNHMARA